MCLVKILTLERKYIGAIQCKATGLACKCDLIVTHACHKLHSHKQHYLESIHYSVEIAVYNNNVKIILKL